MMVPLSRDDYPSTNSTPTHGLVWKKCTSLPSGQLLVLGSIPLSDMPSCIWIPFRNHSILTFFTTMDFLSVPPLPNRDVAGKEEGVEEKKRRRTMLETAANHLARQILN